MAIGNEADLELSVYSSGDQLIDVCRLRGPSRSLIARCNIPALQIKTVASVSCLSWISWRLQAKCSTVCRNNSR